MHGMIGPPAARKNVESSLWLQVAGISLWLFIVGVLVLPLVPARADPVTATITFNEVAAASGIENDQWLTTNAMKSAFIHFDERLDIINGIIKPRYAELAA